MPCRRLAVKDAEGAAQRSKILDGEGHGHTLSRAARHLQLGVWTEFSFEPGRPVLVGEARCYEDVAPVQEGEIAFIA